MERIKNTLERLRIKNNINHQHGVQCMAQTAFLSAAVECCALHTHDCSFFELPSHRLYLNHINSVCIFFEITFEAIVWCMFQLNLSIFLSVNDLGIANSKSALSKHGVSQ
jgi:hypothetical protein